MRKEYTKALGKHGLPWACPLAAPLSPRRVTRFTGPRGYCGVNRYPCWGSQSDLWGVMGLVGERLSSRRPVRLARMPVPVLGKQGVPSTHHAHRSCPRSFLVRQRGVLLSPSSITVAGWTRTMSVAAVLSATAPHRSTSI